MSTDKNENKLIDSNINNSEESEHKIDKDKGKPDFVHKEKIIGPSHASASNDKVTTGIDSNELEYNPFRKIY